MKLDGRTNRARKILQSTRRRILDAVVNLFSKNGYSNTSISDIAREAGTGRATIYLHFRTKAAILKVLTDEILSKMGEVLKSSDLDDVERVEAEHIKKILDDLIGVYESNKKLFNFIIQGGISEGNADVLTSFYKEFNVLVEENLRQQIDARRIRPLDVSVTALVISGALKDVLIHPLARGEYSPEKARTVAASMVNVVYYGLRLNPDQNI